MTETTKKRMSELLQVSEAEVERRIASGELQARKVTGSKFSDWAITIPKNLPPPPAQILKEVKENLQQPVPEHSIPEPTSHVDTVSPEPKPSQPEQKSDEKEEKVNDNARPEGAKDKPAEGERTEAKWWF